MDNQNSQVQNAVFGKETNFGFLLTKNSFFEYARDNFLICNWSLIQDALEIFINEIRNIKHKLLNQTLCDTLIEHIEQSNQIFIIYYLFNIQNKIFCVYTRKI